MILRPVILFGMVVSIVGGIVIGVSLYWWTSVDDEVARDERLLLSVVREIGDSYIEELPRRQLIDNAIRGIIDGLDDHSTFLDERALVMLEEETSGRFGGIGVTLRMVDGQVTVVTPIAGAPAEQAGIVAGDRVIEVDHEPFGRRSLADAVKRLRGEPGTDVHLRVRREAATEPLDFDLTRDTIKVSTVTSRLLEPGYGYVRIRQFNDDTTDDVADAVASFARNAPLDGLVLDLRNNPGGLLEASVAVADAFLTGGLIVYTEGRAPKSQTRYEADAAEISGGVPLALLINGGSASAAEVVAGALQDQSRATVLGTKSFGKGSVQSVRFLQRNRALKLTTARYRTPSGHSIHDRGVVPDIVVEMAEGESRDQYDERLLAEALAQLRR